MGNEVCLESFLGVRFSIWHTSNRGGKVRVPPMIAAEGCKNNLSGRCIGDLEPPKAAEKGKGPRCDCGRRPQKNLIDRCVGDQVCFLGSSPTGKGGPLYC